jgi:hypothetical protein
MKQLSILFLLGIVLTSCGILNSGNGKLRYVRSEKGEITVVERQEKDPVQFSEVAANNKEESNSETEETTSVLKEYSSVAGPDAIVLTEDKNTQKKSEIPQQPLDLNPDEDERIIDEAYEAERAANTSFILMVVGLISAIAPYLGIIPFFIGLYFYSKSDRSRYITQFGERKQRSAQVVMIIDTVILSLWLLLIVTLFFL